MDHVALLEHLQHGVRGGFRVRNLSHRLVHCRIEGLALGLDLRDGVLRECPEDLPEHQLDAVEDSLGLFSGILRPVLEGAFQIIDRRKKILDEILVAELEALLLLLEAASAEILEFGL